MNDITSATPRQSAPPSSSPAPSSAPDSSPAQPSTSHEPSPPELLEHLSKGEDVSDYAEQKAEDRGEINPDLTPAQRNYNRHQRARQKIERLNAENAELKQTRNPVPRASDDGTPDDVDALEGRALHPEETAKLDAAKDSEVEAELAAELNSGEQPTDGEQQSSRRRRTSNSTSGSRRRFAQDRERERHAAVFKARQRSRRPVCFPTIAQVLAQAPQVQIPPTIERRRFWPHTWAVHPVRLLASRKTRPTLWPAAGLRQSRPNAYRRAGRRRSKRAHRQNRIAQTRSSPQHHRNATRHAGTTADQAAAGQRRRADARHQSASPTAKISTPTPRQRLTQMRANRTGNHHGHQSVSPRQSAGDPDASAIRLHARQKAPSTTSPASATPSARIACASRSANIVAGATDEQGNVDQNKALAGLARAGLVEPRADLDHGLPAAGARPRHAADATPETQRAIRSTARSFRTARSISVRSSPIPILGGGAVIEAPRGQDSHRSSILGREQPPRRHQHQGRSRRQTFPAPHATQLQAHRIAAAELLSARAFDQRRRAADAAAAGPGQSRPGRSRNAASSRRRPQ